MTSFAFVFRVRIGVGGGITRISAVVIDLGATVGVEILAATAGVEIAVAIVVAVVVELGATAGVEIVAPAPVGVEIRSYHRSRSRGGCLFCRIRSDCGRKWDGRGRIQSHLSGRCCRRIRNKCCNPFLLFFTTVDRNVFRHGSNFFVNASSRVFLSHHNGLQ